MFVSSPRHTAEQHHAVESEPHVSAQLANRLLLVEEPGSGPPTSWSNEPESSHRSTARHDSEQRRNMPSMSLHRDLRRDFLLAVARRKRETTRRSEELLRASIDRAPPLPFSLASRHLSAHPFVMEEEDFLFRFARWAFQQDPTVKVTSICNILADTLVRHVSC